MGFGLSCEDAEDRDLWSLGMLLSLFVKAVLKVDLI